MKQVSKNFWCLRTEFDERKLIFFGSSESEVLGKYNAWFRRWTLSTYL